MPWKKGKKTIGQFRKGKLRKERVFKTMKEAKNWEAKMRNLSFEELNKKIVIVCLIDWATNYLDHDKSMYATMTDKETQRMFRSFFKHVDPTLPVSKLTPAMVMAYLLTQKDERSGYAGNKNRKNLIAAWNWGQMYMTLVLPSPNPCTVKKMPEIRNPRYVPPAADFWKVYNLLPEGQDRVMLLTFLHTAARRGEIFRLTVSDLDFENNRIRLSTRKRTGGNLEYDWLPMTAELKGELSWWLENRPLKNKPHVFMCLEERPFHFEHYGEPFKFRAKFMKKLCALAGVKPFGFHSVRHLTASQLYSMGYSVGTIQALLRHKSAGTTERYLRTLGLEHVRDAVEGLSAMGEKFDTSGGDRKDRQECRH
jgi:integrase